MIRILYKKRGEVQAQGTPWRTRVATAATGTDLAALCHTGKSYGHGMTINILPDNVFCRKNHDPDRPGPPFIPVWCAHTT
jgi:hypothetical protein